MWFLDKKLVILLNVATLKGQRLRGRTKHDIISKASMARVRAEEESDGIWGWKMDIIKVRGWGLSVNMMESHWRTLKGEWPNLTCNFKWWRRIDHGKWEHRGTEPGRGYYTWSSFVRWWVLSPRGRAVGKRSDLHLSGVIVVSSRNWL